MKTGDPAKRSGLYTTAELEGKLGPVGVSTGFEVDRRGEVTQNPGKFTAGPVK